jgi:hypothetical protein
MYVHVESASHEGVAITCRFNDLEHLKPHEIEASQVFWTQEGTRSNAGGRYDYKNLDSLGHTLLDTAMAVIANVQLPTCLAVSKKQCMLFSHTA